MDDEKLLEKMVKLPQWVQSVINKQQRKIIAQAEDIEQLKGDVGKTEIHAMMGQERSLPINPFARIRIGQFEVGLEDDGSIKITGRNHLCDMCVLPECSNAVSVKYIMRG